MPWCNQHKPCLLWLCSLLRCLSDEWLCERERDLFLCFVFLDFLLLSRSLEPPRELLLKRHKLQWYQVHLSPDSFKTHLNCSSFNDPSDFVLFLSIYTALFYLQLLLTDRSRLSRYTSAYSLFVQYCSQRHCKKKLYNINWLRSKLHFQYHVL